MNAKNIIIDSLTNLSEARLRKSVVAVNSRNMKELELAELTKEEAEQVKSKWGLKDMRYHRMFKTFNGFDVRYVSDASFVPRILRALNPIDMARAFEHKSLYGLLFKGIPQPKCLVSYLPSGGGILWNRNVSV